jgi:threonine aldolase
MSKVQRGFASDNNSGIHPAVLDAMTRANLGHVKAYGDDPYTERAAEKFKALFKKPAEVYFTFNGTSANVLGLKTLTHSHHAILCAETAHIHLDECGAPEFFTGCKLIPVSAPDGKLTVESVSSAITGLGNVHHVQPKVISITQSTEYGTIYQPDEIKRLATLAHSKGMYLHVDGARISNAVAALGCSLNDLICETGVDVLSFGGTKNGMMCGEAVICFNSDLATDFKYIRKQGMQLASKMRFISAQFEALLTNGLWLENAKHANRMAELLFKRLEKIQQIKITQKVEANALFAVLPFQMISVLQRRFPFYVWNDKKFEVRLVTSFDTTEQDVNEFADLIQSEVARLR